MKKTINKTVGAALILLTVLSCFGGCVDNSDAHVHSFEQRMDENGHYKECNCGEIIDRAEHTFEWITDSEPTYIAPGYKYKECSACGYKTDESTKIERLLHEETIVDSEIKNNSSRYSRETFSSQNELIAFLDNNKDKIDSKFISINAVSNPEENIHIIFEDYRVSYVFSYDDEGYFPWTENEPEEYLNPCVSISYDLYSEDLGSFIDLGDNDDGYPCSIAFLMRFCEITDEEISPTFEFYNYCNSNSTMKSIIKVMNNGKCIGEIFYRTEGLYVSREWIVDYLSNNLFVVN